MLIYNLLYNNYFEIIDLNKSKAENIIKAYIIASKNRKTYIKKINIVREKTYLIKKINKEIEGDDAKIVLNNILEKFINRYI